MLHRLDHPARLGLRVVERLPDRVDAPARHTGRLELLDPRGGRIGPERIGDEAEKIARMAVRLVGEERPKNNYAEIQAIGNHVRQMVHDALDAFARLDIEAAIRVAREDIKVDQKYDGAMRQLITYMMEDPRTISRVLNVIWAARALERIGDHACNICEYIIYLVKGKDVRHTSLDQVEREILGKE